MLEEKVLRGMIEIAREKYQKKILYDSFKRLKIITDQTSIKCFKKEAQKELQDDIKGIILFISWGFLRGRNDELSEKYSIPIIEQLHKEKTLSDISNNSEKIIEKWKKKIREYKTKENRSYKVNENDEDFLKGFLREDSFKKVEIRQVKETIENTHGEGLRKIYNELDEIDEVGDKIAGCFIRDIVWIYDLEEKLRKDDIKYIFPVDTWVKQVYVKIANYEVKEKEIKNNIIDKCLEYKISPIEVNQGMWYIGAHSLDIAISLIKNGINNCANF